jgi:choline kinase
MLKRTDQTTPRGNLTLLVLAAGMGSRFGGLKQVASIGPAGEAVLEYSVFDAIYAGFNKVVLVIRREFENQIRTQIASRFESRIAVEYAYQDLADLPDGFRVPEGRTKPWGTAHAVLAARGHVTAPFAVINADDFYGADSYARLANFLHSTSPHDTPARFCLVAYSLGNTLSENGTVSRGVCRIRDDNTLESITEREQIRAGFKGPEAALGATWEALPAETPVSMNMMGFTPDLFPILEERFRLFLQERGKDLKAECYLPESVTYAINHKKAVVEVLQTSGDWMGITYPADIEHFARSIAQKCAAGEYPNPLWPD